MASRKKSAKKVVDKWKLKRTYKVMAPKELGGKDVGEIISSNPDNLFNRVISLSYVDLYGRDVGSLGYYITLKLRVVDVGEDRVMTELVGHTTAFSYLRSIARRRRSVLHDSFKVTTKDGKVVWVKPVVVTFRKVSAIMKKNVRKTLQDEIKARAAKYNYYDLMKKILDGSFATDIAKELNKITPISHLLIKKTELEAARGEGSSESSEAKVDKQEEASA